MDKPDAKGKAAPSVVTVSEDNLRAIADNSLSYFGDIAEAAGRLLDERRPSGPAALASVNSFTDTTALKNLSSVTNSTDRGLLKLLEEPAIARLVLRDEQGRRQTYFITEGGALPKGLRPEVTAHYLSKFGRMASAAIGESHEIETPNGTRVYKILERTELKPSFEQLSWDSIDSVVRVGNLRPITIKSLKLLIAPRVREGDPLEALLADERSHDNVLSGLRRSAITKTTLRQQRILDRYQDDIFRLPLNTQLVILGPPGTGKTTTLIKRLAQKVSAQFLTAEELTIVQRTSAGEAGHPNSWLMFTPTELLKLYIKESFNRQGIAAPDARIQTWEHFGRELARTQFGILRTGRGGGPLVVKERLEAVQPNTLEHQTDWFDHFNAWQEAAFWEDLKEHAQHLADSKSEGSRKIGIRLAGALQMAKDAASRLIAISAAVPDLERLIDELRGQTDGKIRKALADELGNDSTLLPSLVEFVVGLDDGSEDIDESENEDEDEVRPVREGRAAAFEAYIRATRAQARAAVSKRGVNGRSRNGRMLAWLGPRTMQTADLLEVGAALNVLTSARRFLNPGRRYIIGISRRYRRYRREQQAAGRWYKTETLSGGDVSPLELDVVLLAMLRRGRELLSDPRIRQQLQGAFASLRVIEDLNATQVVVDEATDFSPIQLACMGCLCDPAARSFVACGDFNQRVTESGIRTASELRWIFPDIDIQPVKTTYRHTRQLNELAKRIAAITVSDTPVSELPPDMENEGVPPMLGKNLSGNSAVVAWLAKRIREIERFAEIRPSIAILVNNEADVLPLSEALGKALVDQSIRVEPCPGGRSLGQESDVRVFDVQHIKGLEFEAVFFVGIDRLAVQFPDLFDKYLYVGATRAGYYAGFTIEGALLPPAMAGLEDAFRLI